MKLLHACLILAFAATICGCQSSKSTKAKAPEKEPLTALKNVDKRTFVATSEIGQDVARARIAWINAVSKNETIRSYEFLAGNYRPRESSFERDLASAKKFSSVESLVAELQLYVKDMPVGFVLTLDGELPYNDAEPPEYFKAFVREFQRAMAFEGIKYIYIVSSHWNVVK